jgi:hypothetical protein
MATSKKTKTAPVAEAAPKPAAAAAPAASPKAAAPSKAPAPKPEVTWQAIERRAYEIFARRGYAPGDPTADWLEAERQLRNGQ